MRHEHLPKIFIFQCLKQFGRHLRHAERIKHGCFKPNHFRQAGRIGRDGGRAAGHSFQCRKTKSFLPRGEHKAMALGVKHHQLLV